MGDWTEDDWNEELLRCDPWLEDARGEKKGDWSNMRKKLQVFVLSMVVVALLVIVIPTAFMRYPLAMQVATFWVAFGLLADRIGRD